MRKEKKRKERHGNELGVSVCSCLFDSKFAQAASRSGQRPLVADDETPQLPPDYPLEALVREGELDMF